MRMLAVLLVAVFVALAQSGCGTAGAKKTEENDPIKIAKDARLDSGARVAAVDRIWAERREGEKGRDAARDALEGIAWGAANGAKVRIRALETLLADPDDAEHGATRGTMAMIVALEPDPEVVRFIAEKAGAGGWREFAGPLVRVWARRPGVPPENDRPEAKAIAALFPGRTVVESVFGVFATPAPAGLTGQGAKRAEEARRAAWDLLSRLDPDGSARVGLMAGVGNAGDPMVAAVRACAADLGCVPTTASQLRRLERLREFGDERNRRWWSETAAAVGRLGAEHKRGLAMRHLEPVRWAAEHHTEWLARDKASLLTELRQRLRGRATVGRNVGDLTQSSVNRDRLEDWSEKMSWADVVTVLVVDEAVHGAGLTAEFLSQAERDRRNTTTEYGGLLWWNDGEGRWACTLYVPRAGQSTDDHRFVASEEMLADGARALAHYHLHAQQVNNSDFAGPSPGDCLYADEQGVACVVLTQTGPGTLDADYYHAGMVTIDLGELK